MLRVNYNSRQIPKVKEMTSNQHYSDLVYGYLQSVSFLYGTQRFVSKEDCVFTVIAKKIKKDRKTVAKYFKYLIDLGLIVEDYEMGGYELKQLNKSLAILVPQETLKQLVTFAQNKCISLYAYLLNRFIANEERPFMVKVETLKMFLGISTKTHNDDTIEFILRGLDMFGLVKYCYQFDPAERKTHLIIQKVDNECTITSKKRAATQQGFAYADLLVDQNLGQG